jgi:hypothetical protein
VGTRRDYLPAPTLRRRHDGNGRPPPPTPVTEREADLKVRLRRRLQDAAEHLRKTPVNNSDSSVLAGNVRAQRSPTSNAGVDQQPVEPARAPIRRQK